MIKLDLVPSSIKPVLHASQYDDGRQWQCEVMNDGVPFVFQNGDTVEFSLRKGDGLVVTTNVAVTPGSSIITLVSTEQMCAVYGSNLGELKIQSNGVKVGSVNVILEIERDPTAADKASRSEIWDLPAQVDACVKQELETVGAKLTGYDNTESGLDATNVQDALDELAQKPSVDAYTKQESDAFITDEYDATSTYAIGDMVIHENALYVCSTAITTAEAWNSAHWTLTDIATAIGTVKTAIPTKTSDLQNDSGFAQIDDSEESASKTWSSKKINGLISGQATSLNVFNKDSNIGVGQNVIKNTTGANNSALGGSALQNVTTGGYNTGVGRSAGDTITTGSNNTIIGYNADVNANNNAAATAVGKTAIAGEHSVSVGANTSATGSYSVAVGDSAQATTNNSLALGRKAKANFVGAVAIGTDDQGTGAEASEQDEFVFGTSRHKYKFPGKLRNLIVTSATPNPTLGIEIAPDISGWNGSGAVWNGSYWELSEGDSISTPITVEADSDYLIVLTVSNAVTPNAEVKPMTISLDEDSISIFGANDATWQVVLHTTNSGSVNLSMGGATWSGRISNVSVKKVTSYIDPDITIETRNLHAYGTNVVFGNGHSKMALPLLGNTAVGYESQVALNSGKGNTAFGIKTQKSLTNGSHNTAVGENVQELLTTGMYNTAMGFHTQEHLISGCWNVSVGNENLKDTTTGCNNTTMGRRALNSLIDGHKNTVMGAQAGFVRDGVWDTIASIHSNEQAFFGFQATQYGAGQQDKACAFGSHACSNENGLALGSYTQAQGNGSVAIGMDSNGNSAVATSDDDFVLGTTAHRFIFGDKVIKFNNDNTVTWETLT